MPRGVTTLRRAIARLHPELHDLDDLIRSGLFMVDGAVIANPESMVGPGSHISLVRESPLRGEAKLQAALDTFSLTVEGRVCLDAGAAAGGFTKVLLQQGASRVYAVDTGHGQLLGSLRQDPRVVNLEATNLGSLNRRLVPEIVDMVTLDLSYISLTDAVPQLDRVELAPNAQLVALVKPMFELHMSRPPDDNAEMARALTIAIDGVERAGWRVVETMDSPVTGSRGAREMLVHATRPG